MMLRPTPSGEWEPPSRTYHGYDLQRYFAINLLNETVTMLCVRARNFQLPVAVAVQALLDEHNRIGDEMREKGIYFYGPEETDSSVFMDYKYMRTQAQENGNLNQESITATMTMEEALATALQIVGSWQWREETR